MKPQEYEGLVHNARVLVENAKRANWELARITAEVLEAGIPAKKWAADIGINAPHAYILARVWGRYSHRMHESRSFAEFYALARATEERAARIEEIADREGLSVGTVRNYGLAPSSRRQRPDLLKDLVNVRRDLLVAVDRAKSAAAYTDVSTLQGVAQEIRGAAEELVQALDSEKPARLHSA